MGHVIKFLALLLVASAAHAQTLYPKSPIPPTIPATTILCNKTALAAAPTACTTFGLTITSAPSGPLFNFNRTFNYAGGTGAAYSALSVSETVPAVALNDQAWAFNATVTSAGTGSGIMLAMLTKGTRTAPGSKIQANDFVVNDTSAASTATSGGMVGTEMDFRANDVDTAGGASGLIPAAAGIRTAFDTVLNPCTASPGASTCELAGTAAQFGWGYRINALPNLGTSVNRGYSINNVTMNNAGFTTEYATQGSNASAYRLSAGQNIGFDIDSGSGASAYASRQLADQQHVLTYSVSGTPEFQISDAGRVAIGAAVAAVTFTGSVGGATTGTLTAPVTNGLYNFTFSNGDVRQVTVTSTTTATWTTALTAGTVTTANAVAAPQANTSMTFNSAVDTRAIDTTGMSATANALVLAAGQSVCLENTCTNTAKNVAGAFAITAPNGVTMSAGLSLPGAITSTLATGTAPFTVASTTNVTNLNASLLGGATFAAPGAIGSGTPGSGAFTTLTSSSGMPLSSLATQATNTVTGNATSGTAVPTALTVATCSTSGSALKWTTNTGFGCNSAIDAATLGSATFASPGAIGGTVASAITGTTVTGTGVVSTGAVTAATKYVKGVTVICQVSVVSPTSHTGDTAEFNLANCTIPAGRMSSQAQLRITALWLRTAVTTNSVLYTVRFSTTQADTSGGDLVLNNTNATSGVLSFMSQNYLRATATNAQLFSAASLISPYATNTAAMQTGALDTAASATYVNFNCKDTTSSADTCGIYSYLVELIEP